MVSPDAMKIGKMGEIIGWHKSRVVKAIAEALIAQGAVFWRGSRPIAQDGYRFDFWVTSLGKAPGLREVDMNGDEVAQQVISGGKDAKER